MMSEDTVTYVVTQYNCSAQPIGTVGTCMHRCVTGDGTTGNRYTGYDLYRNRVSRTWLSVEDISRGLWQNSLFFGIFPAVSVSALVRHMFLGIIHDGLSTVQVA